MTIPICTCSSIPHDSTCPVAPAFAEDDRIVLDSEHEEAGPPFTVRCPRGCEFPQTEHAAGYDYSPTDGQTDGSDLPLVCPVCAWSDKQTSPAIIGFDDEAPVSETPFLFVCPMCADVQDRTDGNLEVWVERNVLMGVPEARVRGILKRIGQIVDEYTELSIACSNCGYAYGEDSD